MSDSVLLSDSSSDDERPPQPKARVRHNWVVNISTAPSVKLFQLIQRSGQLRGAKILELSRVPTLRGGDYSLTIVADAMSLKLKKALDYYLYKLVGATEYKLLTMKWNKPQVQDGINSDRILDVLVRGVCLSKSSELKRNRDSGGSTVCLYNWQYINSNCDCCAAVCRNLGYRVTLLNKDDEDILRSDLNSWLEEESAIVPKKGEMSETSINIGSAVPFENVANILVPDDVGMVRLDKKLQSMIKEDRKKATGGDGSRQNKMKRNIQDHRQHSKSYSDRDRFRKGEPRNTYRLTMPWVVTNWMIFGKMAAFLASFISAVYVYVSGKKAKFSNKERDEILSEFADAIRTKQVKARLTRTKISLPQAALVVSLEKPHLSEAIAWARVVAHDTATWAIANYGLATALLLPLCWLVQGSTSMCVLGLVMAGSLIVLGQTDLAVTAAVIMSPMSMVSKAIALGVMIAREAGFIKSDSRWNSVLAPLIVAGTLTNRKGYTKDWDEIDRDWLSGHTENIGEYWRSKGVKNEHNSAVRVMELNAIMERTTERARTGGNDRYLDWDRLVTPPHSVKLLTQSYHHSEHTDAMMAKALNKRLLHSKQPVSIRMLKRFYDITVNTYSKYKGLDIGEREGVKRTMRSEGSSGQYAKHTVMEERWKDVNDEFMVDYWVAILPLVRATVILGTHDQETKEYRIYQKEETLPYDEAGNMKVTRLIQASSLQVRFCDSRPFAYLNDVISEMRFTEVCQVGINMVVEIAHICRARNGYYKTVMDMSQYDSTQHPWQVAACRDARVLHGLNNGMPLDLLVYMGYKYDLQIFKSSVYDDDIELTICGGQASGDITTSDDNSIRNATFITLVKEELTGRYGTTTGALITPYTMGDDSITEIPDCIDKQIVTATVLKVSTALGWSCRELEHSQPGQHGVFLAHTCRMVSFGLVENNAKYSKLMLWREGARPIAKLWLSGEKRGKISGTRGRSIIASKALSFAFTLTFMTDILLTCMLVFSLCNTEMLANKEHYNYVMRTSLASIPSSFNLAAMLELQTGMVGRLEWIEILDERLDMTIDVAKMVLMELCTAEPVATAIINDMATSKRLYVNKWATLIKSNIQPSIRKRRTLEDTSGLNRLLCNTPGGQQVKITKHCAVCGHALPATTVAVKETPATETVCSEHCVNDAYDKYRHERCHIVKATLDGIRATAATRESQPWG